MRKKAILIFFLIQTLFANTKTNIYSDEACFDGKDIFLSGSVKITSSLGKMISEKAVVTDIKNNKKDTSFLLLLEGAVQAHFLSDLDIKSDAAKILFPRRSFSFSSYEDTDPSVLTMTATYKNSIVPLKVLCQKMDFDIEEKSNYAYPVKKFIFEENVNIDFDNNWNLLAHQVAFSPKKEASNILFLTAKDENNPCKINYGTNNIFCSFGKIDLQEKEIFFENAKGHISSYNLFESKFFDFSSKKLTYEHLSHKLLLKDAVHIDIPDIALIETDEMQLHENQRLPQKELKKISLLGNSLIYLYDISNQTTSKLICDGSLIIDNELKTITANASHNTETKFPIIYSDDKLTMHTQKAYLKYEQEKKHYLPTYLTLEEGVHFLTKSFPEKTSFGIADRAMLYPKEKLIKLTGENKKNVYFWQEDDSLKLCAPEIQIKQMKDKTEYIQGIGDVRFSFNFDEKKFLSEIFYKSTDKK